MTELPRPHSLNIPAFSGARLLLTTFGPPSCVVFLLGLHAITFMSILIAVGVVILDGH